ncbi:hypothetical protein FHS82_001585 [Pseudochelatococcus lubricantis]|uniref:Uncharacterized protein n=1 Tax=Pseudochelatococcus lubricantis TaxID=1538102 RepID=A0ABX0UZM2_9HYPH|nr:hypothetical protein [Pseudochelatococcus lubricantis]NIJ57749.1 hypothetical protein [Pseudochelatococcus lubricantis]
MPQPDRAAQVGGGDDDLWKEARRLYEQTNTPAQDIAALLGKCSTRALYRLAERRGWGKRPKGGKPEGRAPADGGKLERAASLNGRRQLIQKLEKTVAREIAAIDSRVREYAAETGGGAPGADHERRARALATLARTLRELAAIDRADAQLAETQTGEDEDEEFPRDAAALRDTLARRLEQLSRQRPARSVPRDL